MCDVSDYVVGAVLGKRVDKKLNVIHYASKTLDNAQRNYATTEKEFLAVVFACDKFRPYVVDWVNYPFALSGVHVLSFAPSPSTATTTRPNGHI